MTIGLKLAFRVIVWGLGAPGGGGDSDESAWKAVTETTWLFTHKVWMFTLICVRPHDGGHQCIELVVRLFKEPSSWIKHLHVQWIPNLNIFFARYANQAWHTCEPVCPDLTNFDHIGQAPRVILEFFNNLNILWHIGRWPNIENNLAIWSRLWIFFSIFSLPFPSLQLA